MGTETCNVCHGMCSIPSGHMIVAIPVVVDWRKSSDGQFILPQKNSHYYCKKKN